MRRLAAAIVICGVGATWQVRSLKSEVRPSQHTSDFGNQKVEVGSGGRTSDFSLQTYAGTKARLVVLIVVDQMRADYFQTYAGRFTDGFKRLWDQGAVFTDARYTYATTKTAQGHALMVSGFGPAASGIVRDRWYDRRAAALL